MGKKKEVPKVIYEGWMVRYGRRKIGKSFIHMRYFILESRRNLRITCCRLRLFILMGVAGWRIEDSSHTMGMYGPVFDYFKEFSEMAFRVVADDYVISDSGTGIVHCAPAFGEDDYRVCIASGEFTFAQKVTYPLDVLHLRMAVEPGCISMSQVALNMLREEGMASFYSGLGPSLLGIAPYIAVNFCIFDLNQFQRSIKRGQRHLLPLPWYQQHLLHFCVFLWIP